MSNLLATPAVTGETPKLTTGSVQQVDPKLRRRRTHILGAIALLIVAGLAAVFIVQQLQTQNRIIQVRADVPRGAVIKPTDLAEITVGSVQGVSTVSADQLPGLIGQRARFDLAKGSLLPQNAIGPVSVPAQGRSLVGIRLDPGRMVIGDVAAGSRVRLVVTAPLNGDPAFKDANSGRQFPAILVESAPALDGAATLVNVQVTQKDASLVAQLAATNRIAIVQDPQN